MPKVIYLNYENILQNNRTSTADHARYGDSIVVSFASLSCFWAGRHDRAAPGRPLSGCSLEFVLRHAYSTNGGYLEVDSLASCASYFTQRFWCSLGGYYRLIYNREDNH